MVGFKCHNAKCHDGTEGGEEGKGERGEEEGKLLRTGQTDGIEGSIKGPRETRPQVML